MLSLLAPAFLLAAHVECMAPGQARLCLFLCVEAACCMEEAQEELQRMLKDLRITADVCTVPWDHVVVLHGQRQTKISRLRPRTLTEGNAEGVREGVYSFPSNTTLLSNEYLGAVNQLIRENGDPPPAVRFLHLSRPPAETAATPPTCTSWNC